MNKITEGNLSNTFSCLKCPKLFIFLFLLGCNKDEISPINEGKPLGEPISEIQGPSEDEIIRIPTVVHVVYHDEATNISDEKIRSQFKVLNEDFRKKNPDHINTPEEFLHLVADVGIEFELAKVDPDGQPTSGIIRSQGYPTDTEIYYPEKGGQAGWPLNQYLNIWVGDFSNRLGTLTLAGGGAFPGGDPAEDGVVIDYRCFGTEDPLIHPHKKGRTATHEIGHWLNLIHIFGANDSCEEGDKVDDTPTAKTRYEGNPSYPKTSCGSSDMFMNFMDYVDDEAMYMFSKGQRERMRAVFSPDGPRSALYQHIRIISE
ncbi:zinc metalloprotease [Xanthovirga aplysinae]|uniref:zinc metalloprotease n=1 Tax=Xanthovirga aplysinae TaxID=2529853 RepID=UPI0012BC8BD5|nr:zinc metalloprotease [Xanthovirga aplysinae]MTI33066.1 zinc metalloprotease [Xanthovirga aplysinae]